MIQKIETTLLAMAMFGLFACGETESKDNNGAQGTNNTRQGTNNTTQNTNNNTGGRNNMTSQSCSGGAVLLGENCVTACTKSADCAEAELCTQGETGFGCSPTLATEILDAKARWDDAKITDYTYSFRAIIDSKERLGQVTVVDSRTTKVVDLESGEEVGKSNSTMDALFIGASLASAERENWINFSADSADGHVTLLEYPTVSFEVTEFIKN